MCVSTKWFICDIFSVLDIYKIQQKLKKKKKKSHKL